MTGLVFVTFFDVRVAQKVGIATVGLFNSVFLHGVCALPVVFAKSFVGALATMSVKGFGLLRSYLIISTPSSISISILTSTSQ